MIPSHVRGQQKPGSLAVTMWGHLEKGKGSAHWKNGLMEIGGRNGHEKPTPVEQLEQPQTV